MAVAHGDPADDLQRRPPPRGVQDDGGGCARCRRGAPRPGGFESRGEEGRRVAERGEERVVDVLLGGGRGGLGSRPPLPLLPPPLFLLLLLERAITSSSCSSLQEASSDEQGPQEHERVSRPPGRGGRRKRSGDRRDGPALLAVVAPPDEKPQPPHASSSSSSSSSPLDVLGPLPELVKGHRVDPLCLGVPVHGVRVDKGVEGAERGGERGGGGCRRRGGGGRSTASALCAKKAASSSGSCRAKCTREGSSHDSTRCASSGWRGDVAAPCVSNRSRSRRLANSSGKNCVSSSTRFFLSTEYLINADRHRERARVKTRNQREKK